MKGEKGWEDERFQQEDEGEQHKREVRGRGKEMKDGNAGRVRRNEERERKIEKQT